MNANQKKSLSHLLRKLLKEEFGLVPNQVKSASPEHTIHTEPAPPERTIESIPQLDPPPESKTREVLRKRVYQPLLRAWSKVPRGLAALAIAGSLASLAAIYPQFQFSIQAPLEPT